MKVSMLLSFLLVDGATAFAPPRRATAAVVVPEAATRSRLFSSSSVSNTPDGDESSLSSSTAKKLALLELDAASTKIEIARNWGFIYSSGILNVLFGFGALLLPILATEVAYAGIWVSMGVLGILGILGIFLGDQAGFRTKSGLLGIFQLALAVRMYKKPFESLNALTLIIGSSTMLEGLHEAAFAFQNRNSPRRAFHFFSGLGSIAVAAYALANMPISSLVVPGVTLGISLITLGIAKVSIGMYGQEEASRLI